jgi:hypothetical protein
MMHAASDRKRYELRNSRRIDRRALKARLIARLRRLMSLDIAVILIVTE